jgi:hypothetical protein
MGLLDAFQLGEALRSPFLHADLFLGSSFSAQRAGSVRGGQVVARESQLSTACVLAGDPQDLGSVCGRLGDRLAGDAVDLQHLLAAGQRDQSGSEHPFEVDELLASHGNATAA